MERNKKTWSITICIVYLNWGEKIGIRMRVRDEKRMKGTDENMGLDVRITGCNMDGGNHNLYQYIFCRRNKKW